MSNSVVVVGAGLAGCEAAWQLARFGINVVLYEMKPKKYTPAHTNPNFAELVCSNSLRSDRLSNAVGLLKQEMRILGSLIMQAADANSVPAGGALAVDRNKFSDYISNKINQNSKIQVISDEFINIDLNKHTIIATGPLTSQNLVDSILKLESLSTLSFYDAAAPIIKAESINMDKAFRASRYDRGNDYINCPMDKELYNNFVKELVNAQTAEIHGFEEKAVFEGCMPVESMAKRGPETLSFGTMKPVGLLDPKTGKTPYAVVQLRCENKELSLYNLVGFQTRLKFGEQKRVFAMIPGLENAEFVRYGVMHRNTFLHSPGFLNNSYNVINNPKLSFAGQITGVEGYIESAASGLSCALLKALNLKQKNDIYFSSKTAIGALGNYISTKNAKFQPMNISYGIIEPWDGNRIKNKQERYLCIANRAIEEVTSIAAKLKELETAL